MANNPPPENLRYPFGRAIPNNFRWKGKFTTHDEAWWREYGQAMEQFRMQSPNADDDARRWDIARRIVDEVIEQLDPRGKR